ncbi:hypothetical protein LTR70_004455 [Exophiala xenobiotica]|uniref:DUF1223-domain-containing protein n=1 Tax=Lithohypha guttulata TaxID=1690604 RepID=A0ABR0KDX1_9EURO|nr:hypothetical protein LTR24_003933 [Lithohypha guttulata]KAK5320877.1 hypothetical protein LTR70_004455 [Exophiala xenobiotica]
MALIFKSITKLFTRPRNRQLACTMHLSDPNHIHTDACFVEIAPLSVVELYQSQGCKSCPSALPTVHKSIDNASNTLLLTYDVTYWDNADWKDTFGRSAWDARQRAYVTKWGRTGIFTPQIVVDGVADGVGARQGELAWSISIDKTGDELLITSDRAEAETHDVMVVSYDPKSQVVKVGKGTNKGKKMSYRNLVTDIQKIGEWRGGELKVDLPQYVQDGYERVVFVQGQSGGPIVSALKV